ncbi:MAG: type II toxin-antitoxin system RelE/ParE family toxin [Nitrospira sp.]|nr:MAG: type II toxin-antitoxin system RelE/ParE family toxin [Nitrospira sp.]
MSYSLEFSEPVFAMLEDLGTSDAKRLRQVFLKILSLRRSPRPPDSEQLSHFTYQGLTGFRVTQGEYRIVYAIDEKAKIVKLARVLHRDRDYRELDQI